jgi:hypothetical protein
LYGGVIPAGDVQIKILLCDEDEDDENKIINPQTNFIINSILQGPAC